jgi:CRP/FNR family transcriptional regulator
VRFAPKETMVRQGDHADCMYNITAGTVRLYRLLPDGRRQVIGFLLPGDFLGLSLAERHAVCADAIDAVCANRLDRAAFTRLVDERPRLLRRFYEATTHELTVAQDHVALLGRRTAEQKVAGFLLSMRERHRLLGSGGVTLHLPMTRQDIADYLGLTLETVSRTISKLRRRHVVLIVPDGLRVVDPAALERLGSH